MPVNPDLIEGADILAEEEEEEREPCGSCDNCGSALYDDEDREWEESPAHTADGYTVCGACFDEHTVYCDRTDENYLYEDNLPSRSNRVHSYGWTPWTHGSNPIQFYGDTTPRHPWRLSRWGRIVAPDVPYLGIELEVEHNYDDDDDGEYGVPDPPKDLEIDESYVWLTEDGSLDNGFELTWHPQTFDYLRENFRERIAPVLQCLRNNGFQSWRTRTCGMHVHISKAALSRTQLFKMLEFFKHNSGFILRVSGRVPSNLDAWACISKHTRKVHADFARRKSGYTGHSSALNITDQTVEMRIFRGNLSEYGFMRNVEFAQAIVEFCATASINNLTEQAFLDWLCAPVRSKRFPNILRRLCPREWAALEAKRKQGTQHTSSAA